MIKGMVGGNEKDITRIPMLVSNGTVEGVTSVTISDYPVEVTGYSIEGNMVQNGTPTPDAPIVPEECGDRTGNLLDYNVLFGDNPDRTSTYFDYYKIFLAPNTQYTMTTNVPNYLTNQCPYLFGTQNIMSSENDAVWSNSPKTITSNSDGSVFIACRLIPSENPQRYIKKKYFNNGTYYIMLNTGSTALPYEPYGYKIPYSVNSTTQTPIYLSEPLRKIGDYADTINNDGTVTRRIKKLALTGEEEWTTITFLGHNGFLTYAPQPQIGTTNCTCSHYKVAYTVTNNTLNFVAQPANGRFNIFDDRFTDAAGFKSYLTAQYAAGTPVTVWYVLKTPVTESITLSKPILQASANTISIGTTLSPTKITFDYANYKDGWEVRDNNDNIVWGANRTLESNKSLIDFKGYGLKLKDCEISGDMTQKGVETTINGVSPLSFNTTVDGISDYIISGDMTQTGVETTINGVSPLNFTTTVDGVSDYTISGNMVQNGTPDPDNIIMPDFCGERTANLAHDNRQKGYTLDTTTGLPVESTSTTLKHWCFMTPIFNGNHGDVITLKVDNPDNISFWWQISIVNGGEMKARSSGIGNGASSTLQYAGEVWISCYTYNRYETQLDEIMKTIMIVCNTTIPENFIPYGYKIPITCAGTTQNIYLQEPLRKIGEYADTIDSDGVVMRQIKKLVLTGEETDWQGTTASGERNRFALSILNAMQADIEHFTSLSTHLPLGVEGATWNTDDVYTIVSSKIYMRLTAQYNTLADFKSYLSQQYAAGTPVTVWYVLAAPTTETFTAPEIQTVTGANTLSVDTTLAPSNVSITYANTGDPTPDVPITPYECGDRTANLFDVSKLSDGTAGKYLSSDGTETDNGAWTITPFIPVNGDYVTLYGPVGNSPSICIYDENLQFISGTAYQTHDTNTISIQGAAYVRFSLAPASQKHLDAMLNYGQAALPYEPYGYKIPITCGGTTYPIYLQEPLRKIGEYVDSVDSNGIVTRKIKKLVLTGEESPTKTGLTETDAYQFRSTITDYNSRTHFICSHMPVTNASDTTETHGYSGIGLTLCFDKAMEFNAEAKVQSYLSQQYSAGTPVTVWYVLATPTTETFTAPEIATATGDNTLSIDTSYPPSNISLTYSNTGNPTPSVPIYPYECGDRTRQLWRNLSDYSGHGVTVQAKDDGLYFSGTCNSSANITANAPLAAGTYTLKANANRIPIDDTNACIQIYWDTSNIPTIQNRNAVSGTLYFTVQSDVANVQYRIRLQNGVNYDGFILRPVLNLGSTALPYEPYGYKIPITCAGQTTPVYLGQTQTMRRIKKLVLTGTENWREASDGNIFIALSPKKSVPWVRVLSTHFTPSQIQTNGALLWFVNANVDFDTVEECKAYLAAQYQNVTPVTVWYVLAEPETGIINEPLAKIGTYADELHSEDTTVSIPTAKGQNTLTVDTTLAPSSVSITGHIKSYTVMTYIDYTDMTKSYTIGNVNKVNAFTQRRRCNMLDDGTITAYYGDPTFVEDGSNGQVMVYQPKFYYKVEPVLLDGIKIRKCKYYISDYQLPGYKLHPAFIDRTDPNNLKEFPFVCIGAYEGCLQNGSTYITDDSASSTSYKLSSIAFTDTATNGVKPSSGVISPFGTIGNYETTASNRGTGWHIENIWIASMNQLMFVIEMCNPNSQTALGSGVTGIPDTPNTANNSSLVGSTSSLGNGSGRATTTYSNYNGTTTAQTADNKTAVSYRGMENPFGNIWKWIDGMTIKNISTTEHVPYICKSFAYTRNSTLTNYDMVNVNIPGNGYVTAFGYDPNFDWLFISAETNSSNTGTIRDYLYTTSSGYTCALLGGYWRDGASAGLFYWNLANGSSIRYRHISARICYLPQ